MLEYRYIERGLFENTAGHFGYVFDENSVREITSGSLGKPRRRRQRERHQTKGLLSKTIAVHVRYKSLYISLPPSAKQQREMTKFCGVYETWTTPANFCFFHLELNAVVAYIAIARF